MVLGGRRGCAAAKGQRSAAFAGGAGDGGCVGSGGKGVEMIWIEPRALLLSLEMCVEAAQEGEVDGERRERAGNDRVTAGAQLGLGPLAAGKVGPGVGGLGQMGHGEAGRLTAGLCSLLSPSNLL